MTTPRSILTFTAVLLTFLSTSYAIAAESPTGLVCELMTNPADAPTSDPNPRFGWIVPLTMPGDAQSAYQIMIASTAEKLNAGLADNWDSGKANGTASLNIEYAGKPLSPDSHYFWKVRTWNAADHPSDWSAPQEFVTAHQLSGYQTGRHALVETEVAAVSVVKKGEGHYFLDFGKDAYGYLRLQLTTNAAAEGRKLDIQLGEKCEGTGKGQAISTKPGGSIRHARTEVILQSGSHQYRVQTPPDKRNTSGSAIRLPKSIGVILPFRYAEISNCPVELASSMIRQIAVYYPFDDNAARFHCSDPALNEVWELCKYSIKATTALGVYIDGDRERTPYEADAYINQLGHYCVDREYALARYSHEYLLEHPTWPTEWKQHSVLLAWADYMYTGDRRSIAHYYDLLKAQKTLENKARADGLLDTKGLRDIVDWPLAERDGYELTNINTVVNAFYYRTLVEMSDLSRALEKTADADRYRDSAGRMMKVFNEKLFDAKTGLYLDGEGQTHSSLHANMFPLAFGLVPPERRARVVEFIKSRGMACSVYGAQYLLESLYEADQDDYALGLMTSKDSRGWLNMIKAGSTITLEAWDIKFKPNLDWNHAWGAAPANIIPRFVMGVRPLEAGFAKVLIEPHPGGLRSAEGTVPTIRGPVDVAFSDDPSHAFRLQINLPGNTTARVALPTAGQKLPTVLMDNVPVSGKVSGNYIYIDPVPSGRHTLERKG